MNSDCAFRIGKTHAVCQDYAVARAGEHPYVILADGCSSSPDTDIGARLLVKSAERFIRDLPATDAPTYDRCVDQYHRDVLTAAQAHTATLGLDTRALDTTLLTAHVRDSACLVSVFGDGIVASKRRDGCLHVASISFPSGYPYYLNYEADPGRKQSYARQGDGRRKTEITLVRPDGSMETARVKTESLDDPCYRARLDVASYEWVALLSDGAHSFTQALDTETSRTNTPIPLAVVLKELLAFKTTTGAFVQRRMQRFLQQWGEQERQHYDDLSVGAITLDKVTR